MINKEEYLKFIEAFKRQASYAKVNDLVINNIVNSIPEKEEYAVRDLIKILSSESQKNGLDLDSIITILAQAIDERGDELYGTGIIDSSIDNVYSIKSSSTELAREDNLQMTESENE